MPIRLRTDRNFVEEDIAEKMVSVQNHARRPRLVNEDHPLSSRSIKLPQEGIAWLAFERGQHRPSADNRKVDDAAGVDRLSFVERDDIVEIEKVQRAGGFQSSEIGASSFHVLQQKGVEVPLAKQCDIFRPEPPVEEQCRGFCDHEQNHLVELEEGRKPGGKANGISRKIGLWDYFTEKRDDDRGSCKIIWNASHNLPQIEAIYLESIRRLSRQYSKIFRFTVRNVFSIVSILSP